MNTQHNIGIAARVGAYSDAVEVPNGGRWLVTSGTPGIAPDGSLPEGMVAQAELAWTNIVAVLARAGMTVNDLMKVTHYLTRESDIGAYVGVRSRFLENARPASMLLITPALVKPGFLIEIEAIAAKT